MTGPAESVRRARPLLGTLVEITATGQCAGPAIAAGFRAIEAVQARMSFHDPASELSLLNASAHGAPQRVGRDLWHVLTRAQELARASGGAFDITIAPTLVAWGYLPRLSPSRPRAGSWRDLELATSGGQRTAFFHRHLQIDLGGIAKGFAIDRAVAAMRKAGAESGCVNAGGDLRVFGVHDWPVAVRHPARPWEMARSLLLRDGAAATSAGYYSRRNWRRRMVSPLLDGRTRQPSDDGQSATVLAPEAIFADALTKIALALRDDAAPILERYGASALLLDAAGKCAILGAPFHAAKCLST